MISLRTRALLKAAQVKRGAEALERRLRTPAAPGLLIVGAQKAGTTSLFNYLDRLPGFTGAQRKEVRFFNDESRYRLGRDWYERFFDGRHPGGVHFEATPEYLYDPDAAERIRADYPHIKVAILLREPVDRAYSAWNMYRRWSESGFVPLAIWEGRRGRTRLLYELFFKRRPPGFGEYVDFELGLLEKGDPPLEPGIIRRGQYAEQVARYYRLFGSRQVLVIGFRELAECPQRVVARVCQFAGAAPVHAGENAPTGSRNTGQYVDECPPEVRARLSAYYAPHNAALRDLLGREVPW